MEKNRVHNFFSKALKTLLLSVTLGLGSTPSQAGLFENIGKSCSYYISKLPEAWSMMNWNDIQMVRVGLKAAKMKKNSRMEIITLKDIKLFHPITTDGAIAKTNKRAETLLKFKEELLRDQLFSAKKIEELIPSIDPIQLVVIDNEADPSKKSYLVIQGQGRLQSMKMVLPPDFRIEVEVSDLDKVYVDDLLEIRNNYIKNNLLKEDV